MADRLSSDHSQQISRMFAATHPKEMGHSPEGLDGSKRFIRNVLIISRFASRDFCHIVFTATKSPAMTPGSKNRSRS